MQEAGTIKFSFKDKRVKLGFLVALFLAVTYYSQEFMYGWVGYYEKFTMCFNFIREGTLYGGQPYCESGGPPHLFISYIINEIVGEHLFQPIMIVVSILVVLIILYFILKIIAREKGQSINEVDFFLPSLLFIFFVYLPSIRRFEAILASLFFIAGYYVVMYTKERYKELIAGCLFALSVLSKPSAIVPVCFIAVIYLFKEKNLLWEKRRIQLHLSLKIVLKAALLFIPAMIGIALFRMKYQYFFVYFIQVMQNQQEAVSYLEALRSIIFLDVFNGGVWRIPLIFTFIIATYAFIKWRKPYAFLAGPVHFILFVMTVKAFSLYHQGEHYWITLSPFFIITIVFLFEEIKKSKEYLLKILMITALSTMIVFPAVYSNPLNVENKFMDFTVFNKQKESFVRLIHPYYQTIPPQEKALFELSESGIKSFIKTYNMNVPLNKIELLTSKDATPTPDSWSLQRYNQLLGERMLFNIKNLNKLTEKEEQIVEKINKKELSFIHAGPPDWLATEKVFHSVKNESLGKYCTIRLPSNVWLTEDGLHITKFLFRDLEHCKTMLMQTVLYYEKEYPKICEMDKTAANIIGKVLRTVGIKFPYNCKEGGNAMLYFQQREISGKYAILFSLFLSILVMGVSTLIYYKHLNAVQKRKVMIILLLLIGFLIAVWLTINKTIPIAKPILEKVI